MKPMLRRFPLMLVLLLQLLACQMAGVATPSPVAEPPTQTVQTLEPAGEPTRAPSSTPAATPTPEPNTYINQASGIRLRYPDGWSANPPEGDDQALVVFSSPDGSVFSYLYLFPAESGDTPASVCASLSDIVLDDLTEVTVLHDAALALPDGTPAWSRVVTAKDQGTLMVVNLMTAMPERRLVFLMTFGRSRDYDEYAGDVDALVGAIQFEAPVVNGLARDQALFLSGGESTNPRDYDPATTHGSGDKLVFSGLVSFDPQLNLVPELAESWDISADGTMYTFHLRRNARFHDGRAVTAGDVVYSWERAADPDTASDTVLTYLGDIVGVREMNTGAARQISGLKVVDDNTLQVTIDAPKPYFLLKLTYPTGFVVDRANVESGEEWFRKPNGTGPFKLVRWDSFQLMVYQRYEDFYLGPPAIPAVVIQLFSGVDIRLYESGQIDMAGVSSYDVPRVLDPADPLHPDLYSGVNLCTSYVLFDVTQPPFDDIKVRQAFSMAFDRQKYIDVVYNGIGIPAKGLYPPALPGYSLDLKGLPYDPVQARQLLAESRYGGPSGLPSIVYTGVGLGNDAGPGVAAMAQMWQQNLGVTITIENLEPNRFYDLLYAGHHGQLFAGGWCADYPDPENFADVLFHTGAQQNLGKYGNPDLDAILEKARTEQDVAARIALYQQAEQIIVQDAPALFILHSLAYVLVKPYVKGYVLTPIDIPLERYLWLQR